MLNYPDIELYLDNCASEPLHKIGRIQQHGILIVVQKSDGKIIQASENLERFTDCAATEALGKPLESILPHTEKNKLQKWLHSDAPRETLEVYQNEAVWLLRLHSTLLYYLIEIEEKQQESLDNLQRLLAHHMVQMEKMPTLPLLYQAFTDGLQQLLGFDRILLMEFQEDWQGQVVAESLQQPGHPSFLYHHFPPQDIPEQARQMMMKGPYRYIPDVHGESCAIFPYENPLTHEPTPLLRSVLRNPSELHVEYLKNMGVNASLSLSIVFQNKLWGIAACHHFEAKALSLARRETAQMLTRYFCAQLQVEREETNEQLSTIFDDARNGLLHQMTAHYDLWEGLTQGIYSVVDMNNADGAAVYWHGQLYLEGKTPSRAQTETLLQWLFQQKKMSSLFYTDHLSHHFSPSRAYKSVASGLMFLRIADIHEACLLWFKPEIIHETIWAGNPHNPEKRIASQPHLHPRRSFDRWIELTRGYSAAWEPSEIEIAKRFQKDITNFVIAANQQLQEVNYKLQESLEAQQQLVEELQAAEEELRQTHDFQEEIIEKLSDASKHIEMEASGEKRSRIGTLVINEEYCIISFNKPAKTYFEQGIQLGSSFLQLFEAQKQEVIRQNCLRAFQGEKAVSEIKQPIRGKLAWFKYHIYPIYEANGIIGSIGCDIQNITRRKTAEDTVHNLALVARNTHSGVIITDEHERILWVNTAFTENTGYCSEEVRGKVPGMFLQGPETDRKTIAFMQQKIQQREEFEVEILNYHKSGRKYWVNLHVQPYTDTYGDLRFFSVQTDITNQKLVNQAIAENEEQFRLISENSQDIIALQEKDGSFAYISPAVETVLGYDAYQMKEVTLLDLLHPDFQERIYGNDFISFVRQHLTHSVEYQIRHKNGTYLWVETTFQIVKKDGKETEQVQSVTRNIEERKRAQKRLEHINENLLKANEELDHFVYSVSHDLRSPIASSLGLIELINHEEDRKAVNYYVQLQKESLERLDKFINDIVDYSRNNRLELSRDTIHWHTVIEEIFKLYKFLPETSQIQTEIVVNGEDITFQSDVLRLKIVLSNLISNALNYANLSNGSESYVKVHVQVEPSEATVSIIDNGIGIPEPYQKRIFDMFFRASNQKPGSGIGLYIVKETIQKLGGNITLQSAPRKETIFKFTIPNLTKNI